MEIAVPDASALEYHEMRMKASAVPAAMLAQTSPSYQPPPVMVTA